MFSTDVGPGNTLIDAFTRKFYPEKSYDQDGQIASSGRINQALLTELKSHPFFSEDFPKTTGPEMFSVDYVKEAQEKTQTITLSSEDLIATLTRFSVEGMTEAIKKCFNTSSNPIIYLSGGGMHNKFLKDTLQELLPQLTFKDTADLNINPDAKEAVLFAILANESVAASSPSIKSEIKGIPDVFMGKVSFPG
jgi:anhydro-N-acetylmuramic acid kinase